MSLNSMIISGFFLYFAALLIYIYQTSKKISEDNFVIGGRKIGVIGTLSSTAISIRDGGGIIFWIGTGFMTGYSSLWIIFGAALGYFTYPLFAHKARQIAKEKNYITAAALVRGQLGDNTAKVISYIILIFAVLVASIQLYVIGNLFSQVTTFPPYLTISVSASIVAIYLTWGGYESVVKTDIIQFFIVFALIAASLFLPLKSTDVLDIKSVISGTFSNGAWLFILGFFYAFCSPDVWQRIFSAKDDKTVKTAFPLVGPVMLILTLSLIFVGMAAKGILTGNIDTGNIFIELFSQRAYSDYFMVFLFVVMVSICMSTLDSMTYVFSSTIQEDIMKEDLKKDHGIYIKISQLIMISFLVMASIFALTISDVINYMFSAFTVVLLLGPIFAAIATGLLYKSEKNTDSVIASSLIICTAAHLIMFVTDIFAISQWYQLASTFLLSIIVLGYILSHRKDKKQEKIRLAKAFK